MSGILGVFHTSDRPASEANVHRMAARQSWRGSDETQVVTSKSAALAVSRYEWELTADHSGDVMVVDDGRYLLAADACLYYRADLRRQLSSAEVATTGDTSSHLILAAYKAWGDKCAEQLEGSFAFIIFDRLERTVFAARDHAGMRPLFYAELGGTLVIASAICGVLEHPDCPQSLNLQAVGTAAAGWLGAIGADTSYTAVQVVPMAGSLLWVDGRLRLWRHWTPRPLNSSNAIPFADAAAELREILAQAVFERLAKDSNTAVSMSGGRDSTAVFAAGQYAIKRHGSAQKLYPVSISYPVGDSGRENEHIQAVADRWDSPIHWIDIDTIKMFERDAERAVSRDEPGTSPYENWNVALVKGARACDARIILDGNGGDQLFRVSDVYLADLLRSGHWFELARELRAKRPRGRRYLLDITVRPLLPDSVMALIARFKPGFSAKHYMEFPLPSWIRDEFVEQHDIAERQISYLPDRHATNHESAALNWYLTSPMSGYSYGTHQQRLLEAGVDDRAPLIDRRVIDFALGRPRTDRAAGLDEKQLLRESMRDLIPDSVLAPRRQRTGVTTTYSRRSMRDALPGLYADLLRSPLRLEELGVIDSRKLQEAITRFSSNRNDDYARIALFHTFQTEIWLRARDHSKEPN